MPHREGVGHRRIDIPPVDERVRDAIRDGRTDASMWRDLPADKSQKWSYRAERAAQIINGMDVRSVLDLGCFRMSLEGYLRPSITYLPSDIVRRDARTIVCDLNADPVPVVDADMVTALGVLEHLTSPETVMRHLAERYPAAIVTYNPLDLVPVGKARRHFLNDLTSEQVTALLSGDWDIISSELLDHQILWLLRSRALLRS